MLIAGSLHARASTCFVTCYLHSTERGRLLLFIWLFAAVCCLQEILADACERIAGPNVIENSSNVVAYEELRDAATGVLSGLVVCTSMSASKCVTTHRLQRQVAGWDTAAPAYQLLVCTHHKLPLQTFSHLASAHG
jgi:hypothetical protein